MSAVSILRRPDPYGPVVEGGLHYIKGNSRPHFSLTAQTPSACGAMHDLILEHYPELADLVALHLSDDQGVLMHAEANGWYWLAGSLPGGAGERYHGGNSPQPFPKPEGAPRMGEWDNIDYRHPTPDESLAIFAKHVRVPIEAAREIRTAVIAASETVTEMGYSYPDWYAARQWFTAWIEAQRPRWKAEADACIKRHGLKVYGDPWVDPERTKP